jgi:hypothetical protein
LRKYFPSRADTSIKRRWFLINRVSSHEEMDYDERILFFCEDKIGFPDERVIFDL